MQATSSELRVLVSPRSTLNLSSRHISLEAAKVSRLIDLTYTMKCSAMQILGYHDVFDDQWNLGNEGR